jgi:hypothetical protein
MVDFSNLRALDVTAETIREYTFERIVGAPSIRCAPAVDSNKPFLNARLRVSIENDKAALNKPTATPETLAADMDLSREQDKQLIAMHCARAWGTAPKAADGTEPEFSAENCLAFLRALPDWLFDPFRRWAANVNNFVPQQVTQRQADDLGKD